MSKWDKLLAKILALSNDLRFEEVQRVLEHFGYRMSQSKTGTSHYTFRKPGKKLVSIPRENPVKVTYVRMVRDRIEEELYD